MSVDPTTADVVAEPSFRRAGCDGYRFVRLIATGGMGDLFVAIPDGGGPEVVIKKIRADHVGRKDMVALFEREIRLNAALEHPNIVRVLEVGEDADGPFMAMEYLRGRDLSQVIRLSSRPVPWPIAVHLVRGVLAALAHAHEVRDEEGRPLGIVHRDVSPSNVLVTREGDVKLLDFGIAKLELATPTTQGAAPKGKGAYMAPEQCRNEAIDPRADLFAVAAVLYELTTLRRAFPGDNVLAVLHAILNGDVVPPSAWVPEYPPGLERFLRRALHPRPEGRYQSAAEMGAALDDLAAAQEWRCSPAELAAWQAELDEAEARGDLPPPTDRTSKAHDLVAERWSQSEVSTQGPRSSAPGPSGRRVLGAVAGGTFAGVLLTWAAVAVLAPAPSVDRAAVSGTDLERSSLSLQRGAARARASAREGLRLTGARRAWAERGGSAADDHGEEGEASAHAAALSEPVGPATRRASALAARSNPAGRGEAVGGAGASAKQGRVAPASVPRDGGASSSSADSATGVGGASPSSADSASGIGGASSSSAAPGSGAGGASSSSPDSATGSAETTRPGSSARRPRLDELLPPRR